MNLPPPEAVINVSTRLLVETGENVMIAGFVITGNAPKTVVVRGMGPSLSEAGLRDVLPNPVVELHGLDGTLIYQNDNWQDTQGDQIKGTVFQPSSKLESVIVATLAPGAYTAILTGKGKTTGVGLVEVYDVDQSSDSQLANISTRGFVQTDANVMIGGFILAGNGSPTRVAIRGMGPSLSQLGINNALADPILELHDQDGTKIISNDNWQDDPLQAAELTANGLAPGDGLESGIVTMLPAGAFTIILAGKDGGTGVGLMETYNLRQ